MRIGPLPRELDEHLPGLSGKYKSVLDLEALRQLHDDITGWFMKPWGLMQRYLDSDMVQARKEREEEVCVMRPNYNPRLPSPAAQPHCI